MMNRKSLAAVFALLAISVFFFLSGKNEDRNHHAEGDETSLSPIPPDDTFKVHLYNLTYVGQGFGSLPMSISGTLSEIRVDASHSILTCEDCNIEGIDDVEYINKVLESVRFGAYAQWSVPRSYQRHKGSEFWYYLITRFQFSRLDEGKSQESLPWGKGQATYWLEEGMLKKTVVIQEPKGQLNFSFQASIKNEHPYFHSLSQTDKFKIDFLPNMEAISSSLLVEWKETQEIGKHDVESILGKFSSKDWFSLEDLEKQDQKSLAVQVLDGWSYQEILNAANSGQRREGYQKLKAWLKLNNDRQQIENDYLSLNNGELFNIMTRSLLGAGDEKSQNLLLKRLDQSLDNTKEAKFLIASLSMLDTPTKATIDKIKELKGNQDSPYQKSASLTLGAMAKQLAEDSPETQGSTDKEF